MRQIWSTDEIMQMAMGRRSFIRAGAIAGGALLGPYIPGLVEAAPTGEPDHGLGGLGATDGFADCSSRTTSASRSAMGNQDDVTTKFQRTETRRPSDAAEYNQGYMDLYIDVLKITKPLDRTKLPNYNKDNLFDVLRQADLVP